MRRRLHAGPALLALVALGAAACQPGGTELAEDEGVAAEYMRGEGPGARIDVREAPRERRQAAPAGETVVELRRFAEPGVTVYDPPPNLANWEAGVVYIPSGPPAAPASGAGDTVGITQTAPGALPAGDTTRVRTP